MDEQEKKALIMNAYRATAALDAVGKPAAILIITEWIEENGLVDDMLDIWQART
jgi:hypothetical protein